MNISMQRPNPRYLINLDVEILFLKMNLLGHGVTKNVSESGLFVGCKDDFAEIGQELQCNILSNIGSEIVANGLLRWKKISGKKQDLEGFGIEIVEFVNGQHHKAYYHLIKILGL